MTENGSVRREKEPIRQPTGLTQTWPSGCRFREDGLFKKKKVRILENPDLFMFQDLVDLLLADHQFLTDMNGVIK